MWNEIATRISISTHEPLRDAVPQTISGGSINQAYLFADSYRKFFVKTNAAEKVGMFETEAIALAQISATKTIRVPQPVCWGVASNASYIALEWLELGGSLNWEEMGAALAAMHRIRHSEFGWQQQNVIGATPQINTWSTDWVEFLQHHRLGYQFQLAKRKGFKAIIPVERLLEAVPNFFLTYKPDPAMVHGDLWSGNAGFVIDGTGTGKPAIYDPALYFGDREVDLAMTELFGGFPAQFYSAYDRAFPLDPGYRQRKTLYNLYHLLNHFNLFGGSYASQANRAIEQIFAYLS